MAAVAVTNSAMTDFNTITALTANAATETVANTAQAFTFTMVGKDHRYVLILDNSSTTNGTVTYSIAAGAYPQSSAALTGSVAQGVKSAIVVDAKYKKADNTVVVTVTPASGKILLTDHAFKAYALAMPF